MNILVVVAHPDDPEFFCGGAIAHWTSQGHHARYVIVTGGQKGSDVPDMTPEKLVAIRDVEQREAGAVLGVADIAFLDYVDGELDNTLDLRRDIAREVRRSRPDVVVTTDPLTLHYGARGINHNDHRMVGMAVSDAIFPASNNRMYFPELLAEGFEMHYPKEVYFAGPAQPNTWVDVSDAMDRKIQAIRKHVSQVKDPEGVERRMRTGAFRMLANGTVHYWEAFRRVVL